jgi:hypothetical protein
MCFYPISVTMEPRKPIQNAMTLFRQHGGTLRTTEALRLGIHPRTLYAMRDSGVLEQLGRGLYRLAELPSPLQPRPGHVALEVPHAVICLVSALAFHELTTQIPHAVDVALRSRVERPRLDYPLPPGKLTLSPSVCVQGGFDVHRLAIAAPPTYPRY